MGEPEIGIPSECRNPDKTAGRECDIVGGSEDMMIFGFLEDGELMIESSCDSDKSGGIVDDDEDDDDVGENSSNVEKNIAFWESQQELLQATLRRTSSLESKIRHAIKDSLSELRTTGVNCICRKPVADNCRNCIQALISDRLIHSGYDCGVCKSKWRSSSDIPSGEHSYLEVLDNTSSKKGEVKVIIELNFRAEFEMARAGEEYNQLIERLPEFYVGKTERLGALIKILCSASKKSMREKKMHMAPWRKQKYMQAKWAGTRDKKTMTQIVLPEHMDRRPRPKASMLTFDLLENVAGLHCSTAIRVV